ncbi:MAG: metallophosphoesterase [Patescibacteria group bacterium]
MIMYSVLLIGTAVISIALYLSNSEILSAILWISLAGLFYAHLEPYFLKINKINFKISGIKMPVKIVFIADLQIRKPKGAGFLRRVIKQIINLKPDLVLIGGDLISNEGATTNSEIVALAELAKLADKFPACAVLGNHEYGLDYDEKKKAPRSLFGDRHTEVEEALKNIKVKLLKNTLIGFTLNNQYLELFGTDDLWGGVTDWGNLRSEKKEAPLLVLSHNPDAIRTYPNDLKRPILFLSGHTHGGQIRLPFIGPLGNAKLKLGKKFYQGYFVLNNIPLFITHGLGESMFAMRLLSPPEIVEITLLPENN